MFHEKDAPKVRFEVDVPLDDVLSHRRAVNNPSAEEILAAAVVKKIAFEYAHGWTPHFVARLFFEALIEVAPKIAVDECDSELCERVEEAVFALVGGLCPQMNEE